MFSQLKTYVLKSIKNKKLNVFGLFLLLSFLILVITKLSETYVETIRFSVIYENLPENRVITLDSVPDIEVTVSTHGFNLLSYYFSNSNYSIDFDKCTKLKTNSYVWLAEKGSYDFKQILGQSTNIVTIQPDSLILPYGTLATKSVPVILNSKVDYADGYNSLKGLKIEPDSITVIGSENALLNISSIPTEMLELKQIKSDISQIVALDLQDESNKIKLSEPSITVSATVEKFTEGIVEIPVTIINKPSDVELNYFPKNIKVSYALSLQDYKKVKSYDFKIECDYNEITNVNASYLTPQLIVNSEKVKSAELKQTKVSYIIIK